MKLGVMIGWEDGLYAKCVCDAEAMQIDLDGMGWDDVVCSSTVARKQGRHVVVNKSPRLPSILFRCLALPFGDFLAPRFP
jgi:hypothetical protein